MATNAERRAAASTECSGSAMRRGPLYYHSLTTRLLLLVFSFSQSFTVSSRAVLSQSSVLTLVPLAHGFPRDSISSRHSCSLVATIMEDNDSCMVG